MGCCVCLWQRWRRRVRVSWETGETDMKVVIRSEDAIRIAWVGERQGEGSGWRPLVSSRAVVRARVCICALMEFTGR